MALAFLLCCKDWTCPNLELKAVLRGIFLNVSQDCAWLSVRCEACSLLRDLGACFSVRHILESWSQGCWCFSLWCEAYSRGWHQECACFSLVLAIFLSSSQDCACFSLCEAYSCIWKSELPHAFHSGVRHIRDSFKSLLRMHFTLMRGMFLILKSGLSILFTLVWGIFLNLKSGLHMLFTPVFGIIYESQVMIADFFDSGLRHIPEPWSQDCRWLLLWS